MVVVVPMAGRGSRFSEKGFETPKPLIEVAGQPMVKWAIKSLETVKFDRIVFVALEEHEEAYDITGMLKNYSGWRTEFVFLPDVTNGQLETVLKAQKFFDGEEDILIAAADSYILSTIGQDILKNPKQCAGLISVISLPGDHWSFAKTDEMERVIEVAEKKRISSHCSTGLYYFSRANDLVQQGSAMIKNDERTRGEFYVTPVYQKLIDRGKMIRISHASEMWDMGTPEAKAQFEQAVHDKIIN